MSNRRARNLFGAVTLAAIIASESGVYLVGGSLGICMWIAGVATSGVSAVLFGVALRRCHDGYGEDLDWMRYGLRRGRGR